MIAKQPEMAPSELARFLKTDQGNFSRYLATLQAEGYLFRFAKKILLLTFGISLAACDAFADNTFVFILGARGNPYWTALGQGIEDTAAKLNTTATVYYSSDSAAEEQLNTCMAAIERKPRLIGLAASNTAVGIQCLKRALANGILAAELDSSIPIEEAEKAGVHLTFSVGADNHVIGEEAAKFARTVISGSSPKVLILEGAAGSVPGKKRVEGFRTKLSELIPEAQIVGSVSAQWDRLKAMAVTNDFIERNPDLDLIYAANDVMGLGAVESLRTHPAVKGVKIVSVDGTKDAREAVKQGKIEATVAQLPYLLGIRAMELADSVGRGGKIQQRVVTAVPVLSKQVLEQNTDPNLQYIR